LEGVEGRGGGLFHDHIPVLPCTDGGITRTFRTRYSLSLSRLEPDTSRIKIKSVKTSVDMLAGSVIVQVRKNMNILSLYYLKYSKFSQRDQIALSNRH
jgi:hypothetical protein